MNTTLEPNESLCINQALFSPNGQIELIMQTDGNLVLYSSTGALWNSETFNRNVQCATMQGDGNLVLSDSSGRPVGHSGTFGNPCSFLVVRDDGKAVIFRPDGVAIWANGPIIIIIKP